MFNDEQNFTTFSNNEHILKKPEVLVTQILPFLDKLAVNEWISPPKEASTMKNKLKLHHIQQFEFHFHLID
jgi:hypothetical protein